MIWEYRDFNRQTKLLTNPHPNYVNIIHNSPQERDKRRDQGLAICCWYCGKNMKHMQIPVSEPNGSDVLEVCQICGWWHISRFAELYFSEYDPARVHHNGFSVLRNLDIADTSIPVDEVENYLVAKYDDLGKIDPRKFEEVVGSVFKNLGYKVRVTTYSKDRGIDVFAFDGEEDKTIGMQVKRYKNKIEAEGIRSFAGALILNDLTAGIYITSSEYTKGAKFTANSYDPRGIDIKLWNAENFYDALSISQKPKYLGYDDPSAPFYNVCKNLDTFITKPSHEEDIDPY